VFVEPFDLSFAVIHRFLLHSSLFVLYSSLFLLSPLLVNMQLRTYVPQMVYLLLLCIVLGVIVTRGDNGLNPMMYSKTAPPPPPPPVTASITNDQGRVSISANIPAGGGTTVNPYAHVTVPGGAPYMAGVNVNFPVEDTRRTRH